LRSYVRRTVWAWLRVLGGVAILALLLWRLGTGPFRHGLATVDGPALAAAAGLGAVATLCCAVRWRLVARGLGVRLPVPAAVAAYYRSQFLNTVLPGGVLGDVHRAVRHGRDVGDLGRGVRAVVLERAAGQLVQVGLAALVLAGLPSPVRGYLPAVTGAALALGVGCWVAAARLAGPRLRAAGAELRAGLVARGNWLGVTATSTVVVAAHLGTFVVAARTAGATVPLVRLVPMGLLVLLAMGVPVNVGGWGPREGVSAWVFAAAAGTAATGVATAVVYGVLVFVASLPGAAVLAVPRLGRTAPQSAAPQSGGPQSAAPPSGAPPSGAPQSGASGPARVAGRLTAGAARG
jgi:glycosyltransferase 2 family protein